MALRAYDDWDGAEAFDIAAERVFVEMNAGADFVDHMKQVFQLASEVNAGTKEKPSLKAVALDDVFKMKTYCDAYFSSRAKRENEKWAKANPAPSGRQRS
jgi:hypothetical protein